MHYGIQRQDEYPINLLKHARIANSRIANIYPDRTTFTAIPPLATLAAHVQM